LIEFFPVLISTPHHGSLDDDVNSARAAPEENEDFLFLGRLKHSFFPMKYLLRLGVVSAFLPLNWSLQFLDFYPGSGRAVRPFFR